MADPAPLPQGAGQMQLSPLSLSFVGQSARLEPLFRDSFLSRALTDLRVGLVLGAALIGAFGVLDALVMPAQKEIAWAIRFVIVCPSVLAVAGLTYVERARRHLLALVASVVMLAGGGIIAIIAIAPPAVGYFYYAGLILVFMYGYNYLRLPFAHAAAAGWVLVALYEGTALVVHTPGSVLVSNSFFFISANLIGMLASRVTEASERRQFFLLHRLEEEEHNVRLANQELERRVAERTASLEAANRELLQEAAERHRAEEERQRLEDELRRAQKLEVVGNLAAGVAHDLNNILTALVLYPAMVLEELPPESPVREPIEIVQQAGRRAAAVVQDLLTLARRGVTEKVVFEVNVLVGEYTRSPEHRRLRQEHPHVHIDLELGSGLLPVLGAPVHMMKSITNLVANAAEATLVEGRVAIATCNRYLDLPRSGFEQIPEGEYVVLSVSDTGTGIAPADLARIFEPFFSKKRAGRSGTGLGMTVVATTVRDLGGYLDVESQEGVGTRFDLYLPATRMELDAPPPKVTIDDCRGTERVLVVDDMPEQREVARRVLTKLGYRVETADGGERALEWLAQHEADLLLLDMIMSPGIDGCETYRRALALRPGLRAVIASGFAESERVREVQALGAGRYLRKPYTLEQLGMAVRGELSRPPR